MDLAFNTVTLNCVHMLEQLFKLLAFEQSDFFSFSQKSMHTFELLNEKNFS